MTLPTYPEYKIQKMIGKAIRHERQLLKLSINKVSQMSGISSVYINNIELGNENPTVGVLVDIAKALKKVIDIELKNFNK